MWIKSIQMKKNNLLTEKPKQLLNDFLNNYKELYDIDVEFSRELIRDCILYYNNKIDQPKYLKNITDKWYNSLGDYYNPDYSVYNDKYYFATDLWPCFAIYSRKYVLGILNNKTIMEEINQSDTIIDLGCGIGYSTAMLKQAFPDKQIIGTNLKDTQQYKFCKRMGEMYDFKIVNSEYEIKGNVDFVFASEYFEHIFDAPINVKNLLNHLSPKYLLLANTFNQESVGHFNMYLYKNCKNNKIELIKNSKTSKAFNLVLKANGYKKIKTGLWNNRPNFWSKDKILILPFKNQG